MDMLSPVLRHVRAWGRCALDLAFPWPESAQEMPGPIEEPFCQRCGFPYPALDGQGSFVCASCEKRHWYFECARAAFRTENEVHEAVVGFKYREEFHQRSRLVGWLTEAFDRHFQAQAWDALVPVPLYHRRRRERGFNQARELADGLGKARDLRVFDCLYRYRETPSQTGLRRNARWDNMAGAFRLKAGFDLKSLNLLLIDDVFTTGATTNACARILAQAGASRIAVLTVARS